MEPNELKRQASLDKRRRRNREAMQRARQRDKEHMQALRAEAQRLEETHRALLSRVEQTLSQLSGPDSENSRVSALQTRLEDARAQASRLMRENLSFQKEVGERVKGEDRMEGLLKEMARDQPTRSGKGVPTTVPRKSNGLWGESRVHAGQGDAGDPDVETPEEVGGQGRLCRYTTRPSFRMDDTASVPGRQTVFLLQEGVPEPLGQADGGPQLGQRDQVCDVSKRVGGGHAAVPREET
jgi:hypothetical protein